MENGLRNGSENNEEVIRSSLQEMWVARAKAVMVGRATGISESQLGGRDPSDGRLQVEPGLGSL